MKDLITEARELCSKATPGLWQVKLHNEDYGQGYGGITNFVDMGGTLLKIGIADTAEKYTEYCTFSTFIARSRALISELCDALEKERGVMIEKCKTCLSGYPSVECANCGTGLRNYRPYKPSTNADRIRSMSDEELAEYIFDLGNGSEYCYGHCVFQDNCTIRGFDNGTCIKGVIGWLRQPVDEADTLKEEK